MRTKLWVWAIAFVLLCEPAVSPATILSMPTVTQEQNQWCWAAVSTAVIRAKGTAVDQCAVAEYARVRATWHDFGSVNCCDDPSQGCNYWNYNWGTNGSIQDILVHWGINNYGYGGVLTLSTIGSELAANRPFIIRWGWDSGGGHFVVGHGVEGSTLYYMNPWPGEGAKIAEYSWVVSGGGHTWTHTNILTTSLPVQLVWFRAIVNEGSAVRLEWATLTETNNFGFEVQRKDSSGGLYAGLSGGLIPGHGTTLVPHEYAFVDEYPSGRDASYRLRQIDLDGSEHFTESIEPTRVTALQESGAPQQMMLFQNFPNPFNPSTTLRYGITARSHVTLAIYSTLGQKVAILQNGELEPGYHEVRFDGTNLPSGVYFSRMQVRPSDPAKGGPGTYAETKKLLLAR